MEAGVQEASELASLCLSRGFVSEMRTNSSANVLCSPSVERSSLVCALSR